MGYGRTNAGLAADGVGQNAYVLLDNSNDYKNYTVFGVKIEKTGKNHKLALTQEYHTMHGRDLVHETTLNEYIHKS